MQARLIAVASGERILDNRAKGLLREILEMIEDCDDPEQLRNLGRSLRMLALSNPPDVDDLAWFSERTRLSLDHHSPWFCDDPDQSVEWRVSRVSGPRNDREWDIIGRGETAAEAIKAARVFCEREPRP